MIAQLGIQIRSDVQLFEDIYYYTADVYSHKNIVHSNEVQGQLTWDWWRLYHQLRDRLVANFGTKEALIPLVSLERYNEYVAERQTQNSQKLDNPLDAAVDRHPAFNRIW